MRSLVMYLNHQLIVRAKSHFKNYLLTQITRIDILHLYLVTLAALNSHGKETSKIAHTSHHSRQ